MDINVWISKLRKNTSILNYFLFIMDIKQLLMFCARSPKWYIKRSVELCRSLSMALIKFFIVSCLFSL